MAGPRGWHVWAGDGVATLTQVLIGGLSLSGYYALLAVGFALIFSTLRIFHIAHAAVFVTAGYTLYFLHRVSGVDLLVSAVVAIIGAGILGWLIDRVVYQPILNRGGGLFSVFIASLGVALIFESVFLLLTKAILAVARTETLPLLSLGGLSIRVLDLTIVGISLALYAGLYAWLMYTRTGLEIRALTVNPGLASVVGVEVGRTRTILFLVASVLAGLAGVFTAYDRGVLPDTGISLLFVTFVAVLLGGTRNVLLGSLVGSLVLGLVTAYAGFLAPQWVTISVFAILILLLIARPKGLFG
jgi:branched-chain amino acid transport system permease protein